MGWYETAFGPDYLKLYSHRDWKEAERFLESLQTTVEFSPSSKILDLCCGCGRYSMALTEKGYSVVGLDLSMDLLLRAKSDSISSGSRIPFIRGDMRSLPFHRRFDLVLNMFTSFGYFESDDENLETLYQINRVLNPGGWFVIDYINKDYIKNNLRTHDEYESDGLYVIQERSIDHERNAVIKNVIVKESGKGRIY